MNFSPVIFAIPFFMLLMIIELAYESMTKKHTYRLNDAITNINLGTMQQVIGLFMKVLQIGIYTSIFELFRVTTIPVNWYSFFVLFILYDLCYYWAHRMSHEISLFWGGHVVHHQSEDYNLSVALRQSSTQFLWSIPFYLPLAFIGFDPMQMVFVGGFNLIYQFWIHTEHIDKLPKWFEAVMNTPSHHRAHHGRNPEYIDTNYAGVFIIWDKIFGTFVEEKRKPVYGITDPVNSWNPLYANVSHYLEIGRYLKRASSFGESLQIVFGRPGQWPERLQVKKEAIDLYEVKKYNADVEQLKMKLYIFVQFLVILGINSLFLFQYNQLNTFELLSSTIWIILSLMIFGFYFEWKSKWMFFVEAIRLSWIPFIGSYLLGPNRYVLVVGLLISILSYFFFFILNSYNRK